MSAIAQRAKAEAEANHFCFTESVSSPEIKNISLFQKTKSGHILAHPVPLRASAVVTDVGRVAVDAEVATDERSLSVRQKRVVLTPVCWRQVLKKLTLPRGDGGNRVSAHRGERVISRKAIAQGRPGVHRCPVCSCAYSLILSHTRPRVQRAPGLPCAL